MPVLDRAALRLAIKCTVGSFVPTLQPPFLKALLYYKVGAKGKEELM